MDTKETHGGNEGTIDFTASKCSPHRGERHAGARKRAGVSKRRCATRASEDTHLSIEERYDEVRQLIALGKNNGYLLYDEVNELLPSDITSSDELDELFNTFGSAGIAIIDADQKDLLDERALDRTAEGAEELELDLTAGRSTRPTIRSACTCARWGPCRCSRARAKSQSRGASSAASAPSSRRSHARRSSPGR